jgi:hypothetical protein
LLFIGIAAVGRTKTKGTKTMNKLILGLAVCLPLMGCVAPQVTTMSTAALIRRNSEIQKQVDDDRLGYYYGPVRWVSHPIQQRNLQHDQSRIQNELARRGVDSKPIKLAEDDDRSLAFTSAYQ